MNHDLTKNISCAAVLKPGDIIVLECERHVSSEHFAMFKQLASDASQTLGIKVMVLPPGVKVARIFVDEKEMKEKLGG